MDTGSISTWFTLCFGCCAVITFMADSFTSDVLERFEPLIHSSAGVDPRKPHAMQKSLVLSSADRVWQDYIHKSPGPLS